MYDVQVTPTRLIHPELAAAIVGGEAGSKTEPARDIVWDSRLVEPGFAFIALPGSQHDGEEFVDAALARGAAFAISRQAGPKNIRVNNAYEALLRLGSWLRSGMTGPLVAVTGSVGKTSTKEAIRNGLDWPATPGNLNTPPALLRFFWNLPPESAGAVVELGIDRRGEMDDLLKLTAPDLGVVTAIAPVHLEGIGSLEDVAREKLRLLEGSRLRLAQSETSIWGLPEGTMTYGFEPGADFAGRNLTLSCRGTGFEFGGLRLRLQTLGRGAALAALAALAVAEMLSLDAKTVADRLEEAAQPPHRLQVREVGGRLWLDDSYNASPKALEASLEVLAACPGRKGVVLGTMRELGAEARKWHLWAVEKVRAVADGALFVGEYAEEMAHGWENALAAPDTEVAAELVTDWSRDFDTVLLKGSRALELERLLEVVGA